MDGRINQNGSKSIRRRGFGFFELTLPGEGAIADSFMGVPTSEFRKTSVR